ncbi:phage tail assembly protein [Aurantimonas sp. DM33-3]|uniref:phage tail assembly protein n=1 Tax=Aurantimonas sp. DM33-3 TaxID=2766955 RepID=UPI0016521F9B|nr:phage tail assembly protein [Aurantimonas sp. DM33-3]MBC6714804.1 phage tail assembly protein [Aurantimonas sp. DM33-3]
MDAATKTLRSVPLDRDGTPIDKSLQPKMMVGNVDDAVAHLDVVGGTGFKPTAPKTETAVNAPAVAKPKVRYLGNRPLTKAYDLAVPMEFDGAEFRQLTVRRLKGEDFQSFASLIQQDGVSETDAILSLMTDTPVEVITALDLEDRLELTVTARPFMPRRFQMMFPEMPSLENLQEETAGTPDSSANAGPTSSTTESSEPTSQTGPISQAS